MKRGLGCKLRSAASKLALMLEMHGLIHAHIGAVHGGAIVFDPSSDLTGSVSCAHFDQGQSGSCGGHAPSIWLLVACASAGIALAFAGPPSPRFTYAVARSLTQPGTDPLTDSGVEPADPINGYEETGTIGMTVASTPDGRHSDIWTAADIGGPSPPANDALRPTAGEDAVACKDLVVGAPVIDPGSPNFTKLVAAALTKKIPVVATIFVDTPFESWGEATPRPTSPLGGAPNFSDPNGGGHYIVVLAHKTMPDGTLAFLIWNSWGEDWGVPSDGKPGESGNIWVSEAWLAASCSEAYGGVVSLRAAA